MKIPTQYHDELPMHEKVLHVLSVTQKATVDEVALEIMELQGTASEEVVADLTITIAEELSRLQQEGVLKMETGHDKKTRYWIAGDHLQ